MMTCRRWEQGFTLYTGSIPVWRTGIFCKYKQGLEEYLHCIMNWRHQWKVSLMGHNLIDWFELQTASKDTTELEGNSRKCERTKRSSSYCVTRRERNSSHMRKVKSRRCARLLLMQLKLESQKWHQNQETSHVSVHGWMDEYKNRVDQTGEPINPFIYQYQPVSFWGSILVSTGSKPEQASVFCISSENKCVLRTRVHANLKPRVTWRLWSRLLETFPVS